MKENNTLVDKLPLKKFLVFILSFVLISSLVPLQSAYSATVNFQSSPTNLSNNGNNSITPQIVASGNDIYLVWRDGNNVFFINSTDAGASFPTSAIDIGDTTNDPKIIVDGNNVYTVWREGEHISFNPSSDNGVNFAGAVIQLSSSTDSTSNRDPQIAVSGNNDVGVVWRDQVALEDNRILFKKSTDNGATFSSITEIEDNIDSSFPDPQITTSGNNVYVVWQNSTDIIVARSGNNGDSFTSTVDVGDTLSTSNRGLPQIAASGNDVYVVWFDNLDVKFAKGTDDGSTVSFNAAVDIGDRGVASLVVPAQIATSGNNVYVVWQDKSGNDDIKFVKSTDNGSNFGTEVNISNNGGVSTLPKIVASGSNVFVVWRDLTTDSSGDILFKASDDSGSSFGSATNLSSSSGTTSTTSVLAISGNQAFVAWTENSPGEILFKQGTLSTIDVSFDKTEYKLGDTATVTVIDAGSSGSIVATITSDTDGTGISITLTETSPGTFTGSLTFTENGSSSGSTLKASPGDTITASFSGSQGSATIFTRTVDFSGTTAFNLNSTAHVRVLDQNANTNTGIANTVTVTVATDADPSGVILILTETGVDTGVFGGNSGSTQSNLIFFEGNSGLVPQDTTVTISQTDGGNTDGSNVDPNDFDQITVDIKSNSDTTGISLVLNETGINTAVFEGTLSLSTSSSNQATGTIKAVGDDLIAVTNQAASPLSSLLMVTPKSTQNGAIKVTTPFEANIVATYKTATATATLNDALSSGGGGGGLVRPGLVVNVLAGASTLGGGGSGPPGPTITLGAVALHDSASETISMPQEIRDLVLNHDPKTPLEPITDTYEDFDLPLSINGNGFALGGYENTLATQTIQSGEPTEFKIVFYTNSEIAHTSLYFNLGPTKTISGSDTQVLLYKDKPFEIIDPNGNIATATGTINNEGELKRVVTFSITFSEDIQWSNSDLVIRAWNDNLNSGDTIIYDAIKILPSEEQTAFEDNIPEPEVEQLQSTHVPIWIKNNAAWWSQELIDDSDFVAGIEYLIQNKIITIQDNQVIASSYSSNEIPEWIKNNAGWWSENQITEKEFIDGIQWLISNGIIKVVET